MTASISDTLATNPLLLLFVVVAVGYALGRVRVAGFSLGIAAVLFAGIAIGAVDDRFVLPEPLIVLGLAMFVYTIGLTSGPGFLAALRGRGLATNALVALAIAAVSLAAVAGRLVVDLSPARATGAFAGGETNTPALNRHRGLVSFGRLQHGAHLEVAADKLEPQPGSRLRRRHERRGRRRRARAGAEGARAHRARPQSARHAANPRELAGGRRPANRRAAPGPALRRHGNPAATRRRRPGRRSRLAAGAGRRNPRRRPARPDAGDRRVLRRLVPGDRRARRAELQRRPRGRPRARRRERASAGRLGVLARLGRRAAGRGARPRRPRPQWPVRLEPSALLAVATGAAVTTTGLVLVVAGGIGLLKLPTQTLVGALGGMSHPAVLAYASDQLRDDRELTLSYASVFALALITKIVLAQTLITWML